MENITDYTALYALQDMVLKTVFSAETGFYLSGGTCLHRFYLHKRYSDDLDFFCNDNSLFRDYLRDAFDLLKSASKHFEILVDTRDFARLAIDKTLKVDFVNDRVPRVGHPALNNEGYKIDTVENIISNKITAILGRDEPKDVFDIVAAADCITVNWKSILDDALQKSMFEKDLLIDRLQSFPVEMLDSLQACEDGYISRVKNKPPDIIDAILQTYG